MTVQVEISENNRLKLEAIASRTGKSRDELLNEAIQNLSSPDAEGTPFRDWRKAWLQVEGIWKDREDLPDFEEIRRSFDRDFGRDSDE